MFRMRSLCNSRLNPRLGVKLARPDDGGERIPLRCGFKTVSNLS